MKKSLLLLVLLTILISSCSPPIEDRGAELINDFSAAIESIENTDPMNEISSKLNRAKVDLRQYKGFFISDEELDEQQIAQFDRITNYDTIPRYIELTNYLDSRNQTVLDFATGTTWLCQNDNPKKQLGLVKFEDDNIIMINRKKSYPISWDSRSHCFKTEDGNSFLLDNIDGDLVIYVAYESPHIFKDATPIELTTGSWSGKITYYGETTKVRLKLKENGNGSITTPNGSYSIFSTSHSGNKFYFKEKGGERYSFTLKNNKLYMTSPSKMTFTRTDKKTSAEFADIFNVPEFIQHDVSTSTTSIKKSNSTKVSSNEDWDIMIDDYEEYIDQYIKLYKKAIKGDQSALVEYPELLEKATSLQARIQKAQVNNLLSTSQMQRLMKIMMKMNEALIES